MSSEKGEARSEKSEKITMIKIKIKDYDEREREECESVRNEK